MWHSRAAWEILSGQTWLPGYQSGPLDLGERDLRATAILSPRLMFLYPQARVQWKPLSLGICDCQLSTDIQVCSNLVHRCSLALIILSLWVLFKFDTLLVFLSWNSRWLLRSIQISSPAAPKQLWSWKYDCSPGLVRLGDTGLAKMLTTLQYRTLCRPMWSWHYRCSKHSQRQSP